MAHDTAARICIIMTVGPLDALGYQYNAALTLENFAHFFHKVYVLTNDRNTRSLPVQRPNLVLINEPEFHFQKDAAGNQVLDPDLWFRAYDRLIAEARKDPANDFYVIGELNQYIDAANHARMQAYCDGLKREGALYGFYYNALQILDRFSWPRRGMPWVISLTHPLSADVKLVKGGIRYGTTEVPMVTGTLKDAPYYFTDIIPIVARRADFEAKYESYYRHVWAWDGSLNTKPWYSNNWQAFDDAARAKFLAVPYRKDAVLSEWGMRAMANLPADASVWGWDMSSVKTE